MANDSDTVSISEQAASWWVALHGENASPAEHREFGEWVSRSPEHVGAYLQTARLMQALRSPAVRWPATPSADLIRESKLGSAQTLQFPRAASNPPVESRRGKRGLPGRLSLSIAAAVLLGVGLALFLMGRPQQYNTTLGEERSVVLEDGSRVTLNTASQIEVELRRDHRLVRLLKGEALFDVAHDANRPFDVRTLQSTLRALGTQFDVDVHSGQTTVTVVEGRVAVASEAARDDRGQESKAGKSNGGQSVLVLGASDRVVITRSGPGVPQHDANVNAAISWTWHQLVFEHRPLREVAAEFNRYSRHRIEIEGADLAQQEFTGVFQSNDPDSFVEFLATIPGVEVRHDADVTHIVLTHGNERSGK